MSRTIYVVDCCSCECDISSQRTGSIYSFIRWYRYLGRSFVLYYYLGSARIRSWRLVEGTSTFTSDIFYFGPQVNTFSYQINTLSYQILYLLYGIESR